MTKEDYLRQAKNNIFGRPPECPLALIGHNMAVTYFTPLIKEAEPVLQNIAIPSPYFNTQMEKAFFFSSYVVLQRLPKESMNALERCNENFRTRYRALARSA